MKTNRVVVGILGTILLGAVGSGIWEKLLGPGSVVLYRYAVKMGVAGFRSHQDRIYRDISVHGMSATDHMGLWLVEMVVGFCVAVAIGVLLSALFAFMRLTRQANGHEALETRKRRWTDRAWVERAVPWVSAAEVILLVGIAIWIRIQTNEALFTAHAARHLVRCEDILRPHVSAEELDRLMAAGASISSKGDYVRLRSRMTALADSVGTKLPEFDLW